MVSSTTGLSWKHGATTGDTFVSFCFFKLEKVELFGLPLSHQRSNKNIGYTHVNSITTSNFGWLILANFWKIGDGEVLGFTALNTRHMAIFGLVATTQKKQQLYPNDIPNPNPKYIPSKSQFFIPTKNPIFLSKKHQIPMENHHSVSPKSRGWRRCEPRRFPCFFLGLFWWYRTKVPSNKHGDFLLFFFLVGIEGLGYIYNDMVGSQVTFKTKLGFKRDLFHLLGYIYIYLAKNHREWVWFWHVLTLADGVFPKSGGRNFQPSMTLVFGNLTVCYWEWP